MTQSKVAAQAYNTAYAEYASRFGKLDEAVLMEAHAHAAASRCNSCGGTDWLQDDGPRGSMCMPCAAGEKGVDW